MRNDFVRAGNSSCGLRRMCWWAHKIGIITRALFLRGNSLSNSKVAKQEVSARVANGVAMRSAARDDEESMWSALQVPPARTDYEIRTERACALRAPRTRRLRSLWVATQIRNQNSSAQRDAN